jgi:hypothetical protein
MGLFNSLKGKSQVGTDNLGGDGLSSNTQYVSGSHDELSTRDEKRRMFSTSGSRNPFRQQSVTGQSFVNDDSGFSPPPGPPPRSQLSKQDYAPPSGPPPSQTDSNPPAYHDWTVVPDTALLPPPPAAPQEYSPANNASEEDADRALEWCRMNPVFPPTAPPPAIYSSVSVGSVQLERPSTLAKASELREKHQGTWTVKTKKGHRDSILLTDLPLYFAAVDNPLQTGRAKSIYFEVRVKNIVDAQSIVAIGYAAKPYPPWRLPGWERASIGVHSDDGRRYVNDSWGGRDFVNVFAPGDTVGIGMKFLPEKSSEVGSEGKCKAKAFFTRNGVEEGGWDMDEERDAEHDEGIAGLQGESDMYAAVGVFGGVELEVRFNRYVRCAFRSY